MSEAKKIEQRGVGPEGLPEDYYKQPIDPQVLAEVEAEAAEEEKRNSLDLSAFEQVSDPEEKMPPTPITSEPKEEE